VFRLLAGDLDRAISDLTASVKLARRGATLTLGLRAYFYLALAQYLAGAWDDVLLTAEQGFSAAAIHTRRYELPLLHLAAGCVPTGRGAADEAERHAHLAEEAAASLDYGQEKLYAAMARALVCQAAGDYLGLAAGCAGADVEVGVLVVAGVALGCPCHRPTASTTRPASSAVPMTTAQIWNQDGPVPCWLVIGWLVIGWLVIGWPLACWLVACRSGAKDWVLISGSPILSGS
jgi:hypothetical protein